MTNLQSLLLRTGQSRTEIQTCQKVADFAPDSEALNMHVVFMGYGLCMMPWYVAFRMLSEKVLFIFQTPYQPASG